LCKRTEARTKHGLALRKRLPKNKASRHGDSSLPRRCIPQRISFPIRSFLIAESTVFFKTPETQAKLSGLFVSSTFAGLLSPPLGAETLFDFALPSCNLTHRQSNHTVYLYICGQSLSAASIRKAQKLDFKSTFYRSGSSTISFKPSMSCGSFLHLITKHIISTATLSSIV